MDRRQTALFQIGQSLRARGYRFITPTPATHARVHVLSEGDCFDLDTRRPLASAALEESHALESLTLSERSAPR